MPMIALTFDDGPNTVITPRVLDILEENGAVGTFFLIAQNINPESAEMVRRAVSLGCDIENHSVTHSFMDEMTPETIREEVKTCSEKITAITGRGSRGHRGAEDRAGSGQRRGRPDRSPARYGMERQHRGSAEDHRSGAEEARIPFRHLRAALCRSGRHPGSWPALFQRLPDGR